MRSLFITLTFSLFAVVMSASAQEITVIKGKKYIVHKVEKGNTLYSLARNNGVTIEELQAVNEDLTENIKVGQKILIPVKSESDANTGATTAKVATEKPSSKKVESKAEKPEKPEPKGKQAAAVTAEPKGNISINIIDSLSTPSTELVERTIALLEPFVSGAEQSIQLDVPFRTLQRGERANVTVLLPLGTEEQPAASYVDFYRGFVMGLDSLRVMGVSAHIDVYNTARDSTRLVEIIASGVLDKSNLVIGPVYENEMSLVAASLEGKGIPVVSPLATLSKVKSTSIFQMAPSQACRMDKVRDLVQKHKRLVIISTNRSDAKFEKAVRAMAGEGVEIIEKKYVTEHAGNMVCRSADLLPLLKGGQSVVVVTSTNEIEVMRILSALRACKGALRTRAGEPFTIIGHTSWNKFQIMEKSELYKSGVNMITNYFSHFAEPTIKEFERRYVGAYGAFPTPYAYRGYDAAFIFIQALYNEKLTEGLEGERFVPVCTPYTFKKTESGIRVNSEWVLMKYNADYTITVE